MKIMVRHDHRNIVLMSIADGGFHLIVAGKSSRRSYRPDRCQPLHDSERYTVRWLVPVRRLLFALRKVNKGFIGDNLPDGAGGLSYAFRRCHARQNGQRATQNIEIRFTVGESASDFTSVMVFPISDTMILARLRQPRDPFTVTVFIWYPSLSFCRTGTYRSGCKSPPAST